MNSRIMLAARPGVQDPAAKTAQVTGRPGNLTLLPYYIANGLTLSGLRLQTMIFAWLALGSAGQGWAGLINGVPVVAAVACALLGGLLADSPAARRALVAVRMALAGTALSAAAIVTAGLSSPPGLLVLAFIFAGMTAFDTPIARSELFRVAGERPLLNVTSANSVALNTVNLAGPVAVGLVLGRFGGDMAFVLLGLAYMSAAFLTRFLMKPSMAAVAVAGGGKSMLPELTAGLLYIRQDRQLGWLVSLVLIVPLAGTFFAAVPVYARDVLHVGSSGFGLLMATYAAGNLAGSAYLASGRKVQRRGRAVLVLGLAYGACMAIFAGMTNFYVCAAIGWVMGAIAMLWQNVLSTTIQQRSPEAVRGRVLSLYTLGLQLLGLGWLLNAAICQYFDTRVALLIAGLLAVGLNVIAVRRSGLLSLD